MRRSGELECSHEVYYWTDASEYVLGIKIIDLGIVGMLSERSIWIFKSFGERGRRRGAGDERDW